VTFAEHHPGISADNPLVSILIVNYNVKDYLIQCLRSIEHADHGILYEVVVVDNASADNSMDDVVPLFPWVKWIQLSENIGFGRANNKGLEYCSAPYVLFLNPDTIIARDTLPVMVRYLKEHPEVGLAGCKVLNPDGTFQLACRRGLPTPWASFCKLFGLQSLFPNSRVFAGYNLTYLSTNETYNVDALIGAFMMGPRDLILNMGGFDPEYFMYGEDLDLCYRIQKAGYDIRYVHETSIIHFKGESTRRSSINEVKVFYDAMEIFARKHFGSSAIFLWMMRIGISLRSVLERIFRRRINALIMVADVVSILIALLTATWIRFDSPFGFPEYAYPLVLFAVPAVIVFSLLGVGEYVEHTPTFRRSLLGLLIGSFVLSSLTYFFKEYAFSRGVLLMTIAFTGCSMLLSRGMVQLYDSWRGRNRIRYIVVVGITEEASAMIRNLQTVEHRHAAVVGIVSTEPFTESSFSGIPIVGTVSMLNKIVRDLKADEVILADPAFTRDQAMVLMQRCAQSGARFHLATDYSSVITARIINDVSGIEPTIIQAPLLNFRNRIAKRIFDICLSAIALVVILVRILLVRKGAVQQWKRMLGVLQGKASVVGLFPDGKNRQAGKPGLTGLVQLAGPDRLDAAAIESLNDYYVEHYTLALDADIVIKHLLGKHRGKYSS